MKRLSAILAVVLMGTAIVVWVSVPGSADESSVANGSGGETSAVEEVQRVGAREAGRISGNPAEYVIQAGELPSPFSISKGAHTSPSEYNHIYFNPAAFLSENEDDPGLLGVIVNIALHEDGDAAQRMLQAQGGLDAAGVIDDIRRATPDAIPENVQAHPIDAPGTDEIFAFQVHYILQNVHVYEYRYRFRIRNALSNLIVSARSTLGGAEPDSLSKRADLILERQIEHFGVGTVQN